MRYRFHTVDVFTDHLFGGNPLAVLPDGRNLDDVQMRRIAREFNLSETVFVLPPDSPAHTRRLRIFTPSTEIPFAGHPTIGCALVLAAIGEIPLTGDDTSIVFEEGVGPVPVRIRGQSEQPVYAELTVAKLPEFGPEPPATEEIAAMLALDTAAVRDDEFKPQTVSCGVPFLFVPVRDRAAVGRARLRLDRWEALLAHGWAPSVYVFALDPERPGSDLRARMFAPALGVAEDPATGAAAAALGGYLGLRDRRAEGSPRWVIEQGFEMGRPSLLTLTVDKSAGAITAVRVGGGFVMVSEGSIAVS